MAKETKGLTKLHSLDAAEISLVSKGANRRRFLITKSANTDEGDLELIEKGGPGSGRRPGGGSGGEKKKPEEKIRDQAAANVAAGKEVLAQTQSGRDIKAGGNKGEKGWSGQDHMDAWHAHHEAGMHHDAEMRKNPSFTAARESDPHMMKTPEEAAAIARDPAVRASQAKANEHHAAAEAHYQAAKKKGVAKSADEIEKDWLGNIIRSGMDPEPQKRSSVGGVRGAKDDDSGVKKSGDSEMSLAEKIAKANPATMEKVDHLMKSFKALPARVVKGDDKDADDVAKGLGEKDCPGDVAKGDAEDAAELDPESQAAVRAVVRILAPFADKLDPRMVHQVLDIAGYQVNGEADEGFEQEDVAEDLAEKSFKAIPEKIESEDDDFLPDSEVKKGDFYAAVDKAHGVYKGHLAKLGYRKYPDAVMAMKTGDEPTKEKGEKVTKSANDTSSDLSGLDPKARSAVEAVFKSHKELVAKNAALESTVAGMKSAARQKEIVAKAAEFRHLGIPEADIVAQLTLADKSGAEAFELVAKNFAAMNSQAKQANVFGEMGSSAGSTSGEGDAYGRMQARAKEQVAKSGEKVSDAEAFDRFLRTPEGAEEYKRYVQARPNGI
jgi:hypothetical protein